MKRQLALGLLLGAAVLAGCGASSRDDGSAPDPTTNDELNENKALGMTDVTILYPVPDRWDFFDDMLGPTSEDSRGELLPASLFAQIAKLAAPQMISPTGTMVDAPKPKLFANWADNFAYLRVVGVRLDPCFGQTANLGDASCLSTVRMVAQFFFPRTNGTSSPVIDGSVAVHLFYKLTRDDFTALAKEMLDLRKSTGLPLQKGLLSPQQDGIHPTIKEQGLRGAYATALKAILLKYAGEQTLSRIAFCVQDRNAPAGGGYYQPNSVQDTRWVFGGFEYRSGRLEPLNIASLGDYTGLQTVDSFPTKRGDKGRVVISPDISIADNVVAAFDPKTLPDNPNAIDPAASQKAQEAALKLQNPNDYTTKTADCASCHMAKMAIPSQQGPSDLDFKSYTYRLDASDGRLGAFRMIGYDTASNRPFVSRRVVNETANVLEYLNTNVLR